MNSFANMKTLPKLQISFFFLAFLGLIAGGLLISYSDTFAHNIPIMILLEIILSIVATVIFGIISKKVISKPINDITAVAEKIAKGILSNTADAKFQDSDSYNGEFSELHDKLDLIKEAIYSIVADSSSLPAATAAETVPNLIRGRHDQHPQPGVSTHCLPGSQPSIQRARCHRQLSHRPVSPSIPTLS
jgi:methyl-accepting chemotaxis protein